MKWIVQTHPGIETGAWRSREFACVHEAEGYFVTVADNMKQGAMRLLAVDPGVLRLPGTDGELMDYISFPDVYEILSNNPKPIEQWSVMTHSGRKADGWTTNEYDTETTARNHYNRLKKVRERGAIRLCNHNGVRITSHSIPSVSDIVRTELIVT
tara:strand:+ start:206 stop:670 length:465 start_codon:yes stop_codon:yes gene_type:complete